MFSYIKWELKDEIRRKFIPAIVIFVIYLLVFLSPDDSSILDLIVIPYFVIMIGAIFMSYLYGAYRTMHSYQKETFLLESMIPLPPGKILLAKYILAIIFDVIFSLIFVLGLAVVMLKVVDFDMIKEFIKMLFEIDVDGVQILLRVLLLLLSSTIAFTSFVTLFYLLLKSLFPNFKYVVVVSFIIGMNLFSMIVRNYLEKIVDVMEQVGQKDIFFSISLLGLTVLCYFASVWFIKNKLEVYN